MGDIALKVLELELNYDKILKKNEELNYEIVNIKKELEEKNNNISTNMKMIEFYVNEGIKLKEKMEKLESENKILALQNQELEKYKNASIEVKEIMKKISQEIGENKND